MTCNWCDWWQCPEYPTSHPQQGIRTSSKASNVMTNPIIGWLARMGLYGNWFRDSKMIPVYCNKDLCSCCFCVSQKRWSDGSNYCWWVCLLDGDVALLSMWRPAISWKNGEFFFEKGDWKNKATTDGFSKKLCRKRRSKTLTVSFLRSVLLQILRHFSVFDKKDLREDSLRIPAEECSTPATNLNSKTTLKGQQNNNKVHHTSCSETTPNTLLPTPHITTVLVLN